MGPALTRGEFVSGAAAAFVAAAAPGSIDWSFPGAVAAYARRLDAPAPFVAHRASAVVPAASTIKLLIAMAVAAKMEALVLPWSHELTLRAPEIVGASESFGTAHAGQRATTTSLLHAMIAQSDNTAANVLADWVGFTAVDAMAPACGLYETDLRRHFMDFQARAEGVDNTTTARDMGVLLCGIGNGASRGFAGVSSAGCARILGAMLHQEDRETIPAAISRRTVVANKTGELPGVRHDVAIVGVGSPAAYALALLSNGWTDRATAFARLRQIAAQIDALSR